MEDEFSAEYEAWFPSALPSGITSNDRVPVRAIFPLDHPGRLPAVLILHYWGATDLRLERDFAHELNRRGIAAVIMALPYHLQRTPSGEGSGERAIRASVPALLATMRQSIQDVRRTVDWIESRSEFDAGKIAIAGTSLGAIVATLAFAVEPRFKTAAFLLGGADLAHIIWNSTRLATQREAFRRQGMTEDRLRQEIVSIEPLTYLKRTDVRPALVVGARFDTIIPPVDTKKLIDALGQVKSYWLNTGHYGGALAERSLLRSQSAFLAASLEGLPAPQSQTVIAPTIRLGLLLNGVQGLQVAGGFDLWRSNAVGSAFASVLLAPRGPLGYLGIKLERSLSVGAALLPRRTTFGVFWSTVL